MNKQEAINELKKYKAGFGEATAVRFDRIVSVINQIHEPQKVVVPKIVAEWLRKYQQDLTLLKVLDAAENELIVPSAVNNWILDNQRDFVVAWYDGFEIEREQLFTVEIPDPNRKGTNRIYLGKSNPDSKVIIHKGNFNPKKNKNLWLTESEIKQDFEWAWDAGFAKEVEVKND
ncbi:TPA: DUF1642 domain-containing protein [Streptococcus suis]|nr:DUF1642 domain-containing protein [Streptococcus suis]HEM4334852.1 DUF1642 domain-containing protein [Streptococcus suis]